MTATLTDDAYGTLTEPATLTEVERLLAPAVAAARARFAPA